MKMNKEGRETTTPSRRRDQQNGGRPGINQNLNKEEKK